MTERERELEAKLAQVQAELAQQQGVRCRLHEEMLNEIRDNMALLPGIKTKVDALDATLNAPSDPSRGLIIRVDRLEQKETQRSWIIGLLITSTVGLAISALWSKIMGK